MCYVSIFKQRPEKIEEYVKFRMKQTLFYLWHILLTMVIG